MNSCEHDECSCFFSQEEIEKLVDLTKEPSIVYQVDYQEKKDVNGFLMLVVNY